MIINSQLGGKKPSGTKQITANGTHDVAGYASADVQVPTTAPELYRVFRVDVYNKLSNSITTPFMPLPSSVKDLSPCILANCYSNTPANILSGNISMDYLEGINGDYACEGMFAYCQGITSFSMNSLQLFAGKNCCEKMFFSCENLQSVDFRSVVTVYTEYDCNEMFSYCRALTNVNFSSLAQIQANYACCKMFNVCESLTSIDLSSLTTVSGGNGCNNMFYGCVSLTSIDLSGLLSLIGSYCLSKMFEYCSSLTNVKFYSLKTITGSYCFDNTFSNCTSFTDVYFPAITSSSFGTTKNQFRNLFGSIIGGTVHLPKNLDPQTGSTTISSLTNYPNFGGTNTVLSFDLPSTNHLIGADTVEYERSPKYDTQTALAWRVNGTGVNTTTYYTNTLNDPQVNDSIYSDSACTQAVTTISSIA